MKKSKDDDVRKSNKLNKILRKATIFKKAKELSTLCGVDVAVILYDYGERNPQFWSSQIDDFAVINRYLSLNNQPQIVRTPNIVSEDESRVVCDRQFIDSLGVNELNRFASLLAEKIEGLNQRIDTLRGGVPSHCDDSQSASLSDGELNLDDLEFTFDSLDGFDFDDLGLGMKSSNDQVEPICESPSPLVSEDVDFSFGQVVQVKPVCVLDDFGYDMENTNQHRLQLEGLSQLTSEYSSLADLKFFDDDFDWVKELNHPLLSC